ncbi:hypothetical protein CHLNCDRAFT_140464 [Chlorella variabilis]|uniref:Uncharacterized protein n=1 Tax=Chlorella variabilis TaxID=554065 RepID=E1Z5F9_CHLVA|nr:hypothetical protein CHLNCDRAFT_140464 [Chlorella variabilis]EFN58461.1 hypothetical protein CHLNCDRAFT_140464 [Chlorella variabilis]|eukprot:XP_005850563.1 hypothetical protein CHLNCDRAFT_140464 [Chlorella variabilis]
MAKPLRQARAVARLVFNWFRHDLPEIVAPSSMPDPPGIKRPPRKTRAEMQALFLRACRRYVETWDSKKMQAQRAAREQEHTTERAVRRQVEGPTLAEEFAAAAKGGGQALKPFLASLYQTRAEAYRDAVQQFVGGYKQGFQQAMRPQVPPDVVGEMAAGGKAAAAETGGAVAADAGTAHLAPAQATTSSSSSSTTAAADEPAGTAQAQREGLHSTAAEQAGPSASQQLPEPPDEAPGQQQEQQPAGSSKPPAVGAGPAA